MVDAIYLQKSGKKGKREDEKCLPAQQQQRDLEKCKTPRRSSAYGQALQKKKSGNDIKKKKNGSTEVSGSPQVI